MTFLRDTPRNKFTLAAQNIGQDLVISGGVGAQDMVIFTPVGNAYFNTTMSVFGTVELGDDLRVYKQTTLASKLSVTDVVHLGEEVSVAQSAYLGYRLSVFGHVDCGQTMTVTDWLYLGSSLSVSQFVRMGSTLSVRSFVVFARLWGCYLSVGSDR